MNEKQKEFKAQSPATDLAKFEGRVTGNDYPEVLIDPDPFIAMVERLGTNPNVDVDKLERILAMNEKVLDRNQSTAFNDSFSKAQRNIDLVVASAFNQQTKSNYTKLSSVLVQAKKHWESEGFGLMFYEGDCPKEDHKRTMVDIRHNQGHTETRHIDLAIQTTGIAGKAMMTQIHGEGSSFSYGRRYLTCMIWNIPTGDDDDGNAAGSQDEFITKEQVEDITKRIKKLYGEDDSMFMDWIKEGTGAETIDTIPAKFFDGIVRTLKSNEKGRQPGQEG